MFTSAQFVAHVVGDYLLQSHWMATNKTKDDWAALAHVLTYVLPFLLLRPSSAALLVIAVSHFLIDRHRLARYVCWIKNGGRGTITPTGFPEGTPEYLSVWLFIITDNIIHILINAAALHWL